MTPLTLETPAQVRHQLALELAVARILGMTNEERVEAMQRTRGAWESPRRTVTPPRQGELRWEVA